MKSTPAQYLEIFFKGFQEVVAEFASRAGSSLPCFGGEKLLQAKVHGQHLL